MVPLTIIDMMSLTLTGVLQMNALMKSTLITFTITRETKHGESSNVSQNILSYKH